MRPAAHRSPSRVAEGDRRPRRASRGRDARPVLAPLAALLALALAAPAAAEGPKAQLHGDLKGFFVGVWPYDLPGLLPPDPYGQSVLDFRLKLDADWTRHVHLTAHHQLVTVTNSVATAGALTPATPAGEAFGTPEAVDLSWTGTDQANFTVAGRVDRLAVTVRAPHVDVTVGRQPITFGTTYFFTPLDLVAPFSPLTLDREYKPGVDAVRADAYVGVSGHLTVAAAYAGSWDLEGLVLAAHGSMTFGVYDVGLFVGSVHRDLVFGADTAGSVGPVAVRAEATVTLPGGDDPEPATPFVRAVVGADQSWTWGLTISGEVYVQTLGALDPERYLQVALSPRAARGEIWAFGRYYAAASADYEVTPLIGSIRCHDAR